MTVSINRSWFVLFHC